MVVRCWALPEISQAHSASCSDPMHSAYLARRTRWMVESPGHRTCGLLWLPVPLSLRILCSLPGPSSLVRLGLGMLTMGHSCLSTRLMHLSLRYARCSVGANVPWLGPFGASWAPLCLHSIAAGLSTRTAFSAPLGRLVLCDVATWAGSSTESLTANRWSSLPGRRVGGVVPLGLVESASCGSIAQRSVAWRAQLSVARRSFA